MGNKMSMLVIMLGASRKAPQLPPMGGGGEGVRRQLRLTDAEKLATAWMMGNLWTKHVDGSWTCDPTGSDPTDPTGPSILRGEVQIYLNDKCTDPVAPASV